MQNDSMEWELKIKLIKDINNLEELLKLGEIYYSSSQLELAKNCFSKIVKNSNDISQKEKVKKQLLIIERDIQMNQNKRNHIVPDFLDLLIQELIDHSQNDYYYNIDIELFELMSVPFSSDTVVVNTEYEKNEILKNLQGITEFYYHLEDQSSRDLLLNILAFRLLGNKKVMLPLNTIEYWDQRKSLQNFIYSNEKIITKFHKWDLHLFDLKKFNYELQLFCIPIGISATFIDRQYEYHKICPPIKARKGDIILDAGGCFGDTALYFAHEVGEKGHVFTFEFIPSNLEIMKKNFDMNKNLQKQITIIENPLWDKPNELLYYKDQGPASFVAFSKTKDVNEKILTISIDDLVKERSIPRIDFIKMDIEGAELNALKGSIETIQKFRPKLAIAIYHQMNDFASIVKFISDLNLDYKFYLGHYTIYAQETILFAAPK